jgi:demethylmenaquinone methyltransferase / 2-methoxy-6-polyprenyl-1,4-benzoquinol methylase
MTNTSITNQKSEIGNQKSVIGAAPEGARDRASAGAAVRAMFSTIAPRYDLANHVLSMNIDRVWWRRAARTFRHILQRPDARALDLCCGTGDMTFALLKQSGGAQVYGADFAHPMLVRAREKSAGKPLAWFEADALLLPVPPAQFDLVTSAFGFRNLADYDAGLREIFRVLRSGGEVGILDFGEPKGAMGALYHFYFRHVLPRVGTLISGVRGPYAYLPASVARFPSPEQMLDRMRAAGFTDVSWKPYTFGIAGLYRGKKK